MLGSVRWSIALGTDAQIIIHHRGPQEKVRMIKETFRCFKSRYVYLSYEEHDMVTANTQAVTHAAFLRYVAHLHYCESG